MNRRLVALLVFAFLVAVGASFVLHRLVSDTQPIFAPARETRLAPKGAGGGFGATIPQGMRAVAVAVPVNEVSGVARFAVPGMHVNVYISNTLLLQNIEVLAAEQDFKKDAEGKPVAVQVVNLLVTPEQAERLRLASHRGTIQLVLRNPGERRDRLLSL